MFSLLNRNKKLQKETRTKIAAVLLKSKICNKKKKSSILLICQSILPRNRNQKVLSINLKNNSKDKLIHKKKLNKTSQKQKGQESFSQWKNHNPWQLHSYPKMSLLKSKWIPTKIQTISKNFANLKSKKLKEKDRKEFKSSGKMRLLRK